MARLQHLAFASVMVAFVFATGCMKPEGRRAGDITAKGEQDLKAATFYIPDAIKGKAVDPVFMKGFSIPVSKLYNFTACVKNSRTREDLIGHKFLIKGGESDQAVESDGKGCVNWSERVTFNFLSEERYLPIKRTLVGQGMQSGSREISLAINPWNFLGKSEEVMDLAHADVEPSYLATATEVQNLLSGRSKTGDVARRNLRLSQLELQVDIDNQSPSAFGRGITFWMKPGIMFGGIFYELKEARLKMQAQIQLVTGTGDEQHAFNLFSSDDGMQVVREGDLFRAQGKGIFDIAASAGRLLLLVRVSPVGGPEGLMPFEAVYELGTRSLANSGSYAAKLLSSNQAGEFDFDSQWGRAAQVEPQEAIDAARAARGTGKSSPSPTAQSTQTAKSSGGEAASRVESQTGANESAQTGVATEKTQFTPTSGRPTGAAALPSGVTRLKPYELSFLMVDRLGVGIDKRESPTLRTIRYSVTACIKNLAHGSNPVYGGTPARDVEFTVIPGDGHTLPPMRTLKEPPLDGCVRWEEEITHKRYDVEHFFLRTITIKHSSGFEESREIAINPWDDGSGFGRDAKKDPDFIRSVNERPLLKSQLLVTGYNADAVDTRTYEVDSDLNLKIIKRLRLKIPLQVQRYSNVSSGQALSPESLNPGVYLLRAAVYTEAKDPSGQDLELVAPMVGGSRLVRVRPGGVAEIDADFAVTDPRMIKLRANLVFEILPLDYQRLPRQAQEDLNQKGLDLESYLDHNSGLVTPTFVGVMTLKEEGGSAVVVTTDDLKVDPAANGRGNMNAAPSDLQAKLRPLAGLTVEKVLAKKAAQDRSMALRVLESKKLANILKAGNLEYIALTNEKEMFEANALKENNLVVPAANGAQYLLKFLNQPTFFELPKHRVKEPVTVETLKALIEGRQGLDQALSERLCLAFFDDLMPKLASRVGAKKNKTFISHLLTLCAKDVSQLPASELFTVDRKLRVFEVSGSEFKNGSTLAMRVGADVTFSRSDSQNTSYSIGFSPLKVFDSMGKIPGLEFFNIPSSMGLMASVQKSSTQQQQINEGSQLSSGTTIDREQLNMMLTFKSYESCAAIRVNPRFFERHTNTVNLLGAPKEAVSGIVTRGIMLCSGQLSTAPIKKIERYYSFGQKGADDGTQLDGGDLRNHPWFLMIRGQNDYANFLTLLAAKKRDASYVTESIDPGSLPLDRLNDAYNAYRGVMQNAPGLYTLDQELQPPREVKPWYKFW